MEEPLQFPSDGFRLFGVLHLPDAAVPAAPESRGTRHAARMGMVFCPPFAEEHKQGYRVFVELARRLEREGFACLRFDYRGTGDSEGPFTDFSLAGALRDIANAAAFLRERAGVERVGLIGLRLGASLACQIADCGLRITDSEGTRHAARGTPAPSSTASCRLPPADFPSCLVLWQPIVDGALFYRLNLRRMLVRQMMTHGKASGVRDTGRADTIDLDGFLASRAMCEEIKALRISDCGLRIADWPATLLMQFAPALDPSAELKPLIERLGPAARFLPVVLEPFWDRLGHIDCAEPIARTVSWLVEAAG